MFWSLEQTFEKTSGCEWFGTAKDGFVAENPTLQRT